MCYGRKSVRKKETTYRERFRNRITAGIARRIRAKCKENLISFEAAVDRPGNPMKSSVFIRATEPARRGSSTNFASPRFRNISCRTRAESRQSGVAGGEGAMRYVLIELLRVLQDRLQTIRRAQFNLDMGL